ncbi:hypothetical protein J9231_00320 [Providencia rettgeri]|uniref:hypothetical protein n=1 Tax=Providencia rettgeri TaxID=587 RepID=UPI001B3638CD|nr:hypothetical protein [Providencia rettgeri]MBQ0326291.1 hypothetical protein [Providencia rettgeri]
MSKMRHAKVSTRSIKSIFTETCKSFLSPYGLLMLIVPTFIGGGLLSLLMQRLSMADIGFFILQPVFITSLVMMTLTQQKITGKRLPFKNHIRNLIVTLFTGLIATFLLVFVLWCLSLYMPTASAAASNAQVPVPLSTPPAVQSQGFFSLFPVYFNMYSLVTFTTLLVLPMMIMFVGAVVCCEGALFSNFKAVVLAVFRNVSIMIATSILSLAMFALWSYTSLNSDWLVYTAIVPIALITAAIHRIAVLALPVEMKP